MSLIVIGLNHRTVPVELLERMAVPGRGLPKALDALVVREHVAEAILLSTCNRTEVYARTTMFHPGVDDVRHFLAELAGVDPDELAECLYTFHDDAAVAHLFAVAAGLDSMIIGEHEILGQVREAWQVAERHGTVGPQMSRAFRQAVEVGKRARTETAIGRNAVSVPSAAVALAAERLGSLVGRRVLVVGAGSVGATMAMALAGAGVRDITVANRSAGKARELAERVGGRAIALDEVPDELVVADVLLTCTGSSEILLERSDVEEVMQRRNQRALMIVDVAVPRDVDPGAGQVFGVTLLDIDALRSIGEQSVRQRQAEIGRVREIVAEELDRYRAERNARQVAPVIRALRDRALQVRRAELDRVRARLEELDPEARSVVESVTRGLVNKLLHEPTVRLKGTAGTARGELYADALGELFALDVPIDDADR